MSNKRAFQLLLIGHLAWFLFGWVGIISIFGKNEIGNPIPLGDSWQVTVFRKDKHLRVDDFCIVVESTNPEVTAHVISCKTASSDESGIEASAALDTTSLWSKEGFTLYEVELKRAGLNMYWSIDVPDDPNGMPAAG